MTIENNDNLASRDSAKPSSTIGRRTLLGVGAAAASLGPDIARAAEAPASMRVDCYTHLSSMKFLAFIEQQNAGNPFVAVNPRLTTLFDLNPRIDLLDRNEIDVHVLVPVPWLEAFPVIANNPKLAQQAARLMNDELAGFVAQKRSRFRGVALLPTVDPMAMLDELHRAVQQLGFIGAYLPVGPTVKRMDHPDFEPLYKAIVELDVTLWLHPSRPPMPDYVDEKESHFFYSQIVGWLSDTTSAMHRIVFSGVFDRHPDLRIVTHHAGGVFPTSAMRADSMWTTVEAAGQTLPTTISKPYLAHFKKFYCDTAAFGYAPKVIELAMDFFGSDNVLFGTDTPFDATGGQYFTEETLRSIGDIQMSPQTRAALLNGNARRIFRLG